MDSIPIAEILDLLCYRLPWVEACNLLQVLGERASDSKNLCAATSYLCKKGLIESHVVNCSLDSVHLPILTSSGNGTANNDQNATAAALSVIGMQNKAVCYPTRFYCSSRISAGLYGTNYSQPTSVLEWAAHRRLASAFLHHVGASAENRCKWTTVEVKSNQPKVLLAVFKLTWLCAPIEVNHTTLNRILLRIRRKGFRYEVW